MKFKKAILIAVAAVVAAWEPAQGADCGSKFIGTWRHTGGNLGTIAPDGRALCSEHPGCLQGTWTCSGNILTYTNPAGRWDYTLAPDGGSMSANGGMAVATRIGRTPATAKRQDLGAAVKNVAADVLNVDRSAPDPASVKPAAKLEPKSTQASQPTQSDDPEAARRARELFRDGQVMADNAVSDRTWSAEYASKAEDKFRESAMQFKKAGDVKNEKIALSNAEKSKAAYIKLERNKIAARSYRSKRPTERPEENRLTEEQCRSLRSYGDARKAAADGKGGTKDSMYAHTLNVLAATSIAMKLKKGGCR